MALSVKHWIKVTIGGTEYPVRLGDVVWFYPACNLDVTPLCGVITEISEDAMVRLNLLTTQVIRQPPMDAICLWGSERLNTPVQRNRGCWVPRTNPDAIMLSPNREG